jgi:hypothetical protein
MPFRFMYKALPVDRAEYRPNEIPLAQQDIRHIAQVLGPEIAANAEVMVQLVREQGGVNPNTVRSIFSSPEGIRGSINEEALLRVMANYMVWHSVHDIY